ncbi:unnamed protein product [Miscanthus lutarioriparius]|uniref:UBX domain-containing protein n=1 Tax=Miscanthus lutarioriparius TaxID=422564 RepID=A0A811MCE8_9POAL|nr:unnamed protein product [Miscanthus lutarioriparius]
MAETVDDKLSYFQAVTGISDTDLCTEILAAHNWDLQLAVSSITANPSSPSASASTSSRADPAPSAPLAADAEFVAPPPPMPMPMPMPLPPQQQQQPGIAWRLVTLPFYVVSGGVGLVAGTFRLGAWVAGGVLSRSLSLLGLAGQAGSGDRLLELPPSSAEAADFVAEFEREFGAGRGPRFVAQGFADALQRAQREFKLLFVYLHSPDHLDTPAFCGGCLCSEPVAAFIDENFVAWGGSIRRTEGFKMSNSLNASRFPFCAVVMASTNQRIMLLQQVEGPKSPEEMITILQRQGRERIEELERREREAAEAERKRKEEEEALARAAQEAAERKLLLQGGGKRRPWLLELNLRKDQVLLRFPTGERKERRFHSSSTVTSLYDYVDSLDCLKAEKYSLVSNFPRVTYGPEKHSLTLEEAGLHPQASLFIEIEQ